jgi:hypothetical protein
MAKQDASGLFFWVIFTIFRTIIAGLRIVSHLNYSKNNSLQNSSEIIANSLTNHPLPSI